jgi:hypothetical protein
MLTEAGLKDLSINIIILIFELMKSYLIICLCLLNSISGLKAQGERKLKPAGTNNIMSLFGGWEKDEQIQTGNSIRLVGFYLFKKDTLENKNGDYFFSWIFENEYVDTAYHERPAILHTTCPDYTSKEISPIDTVPSFIHSDSHQRNFIRYYDQNEKTNEIDLGGKNPYSLFYLSSSSCWSGMSPASFTFILYSENKKLIIYINSSLVCFLNRVA